MAKLDQHYYRACRKKNWATEDAEVSEDSGIEETFLQVDGEGALYPNMGFRDKKTWEWKRPPDVTTYKFNNEQWVKGVNSGVAYVAQGVSINNEPGVFGYQDSFYFRLTKGTTVPGGLDVSQQGRKNHFVIRRETGSEPFPMFPLRCPHIVKTSRSGVEMAKLDQHYYRACRKKNWATEDAEVSEDSGIEETFLQVDGEGALYPNMGFRDKKTWEWKRPPDVTTYKFNNEQWVKGVNSGVAYVAQGVSINNEPGVFGYQDSFYFRLTKGTTVPGGLDVSQQGRKNHFVIRCINDMRMTDFKGHLDTLAREAIAEAVKLKVASLVFA